MKVYFFEILIPKEIEESKEFNRVVDIFISLAKKYYDGYSIEKKLFITHQEFENIEKGIVFCEDFFYGKFNEFLEYLSSKFIGIKYNVEDITLDVKLDMCENEVFIDLFKDENSDFNNICNLDAYISTYLTYDDVLLKIHRKGINSLCEFEKNVLDKYCNSL
jgi:hypothetical protein